MTINERIRVYRKAIGLSMAEFGEKLSISGQAVSLIELGKTEASDRIIKSICSEYDVSREWLETGEGSMRMLPEDEETKLFIELSKDNSFPASILKAAIKYYLSLDETGREFLEEQIDEIIKKSRDESGSNS